MVQGQVEAYKMEKKEVPSSIEELSNADYLPEGATCPDGSALTIVDGEVAVDSVVE
ncbi:hypothetical protein AB1K83_06195 [Sporosarcina sp. 179-K 3D1 HS]